MADERLIIDIELELRNIKSELGKIRTEGSKVAQQTGQAVEGKLTGAFKRGLSSIKADIISVTKLFAAGFAIGGTIRGLSRAREQFKDFENDINAVRTLLDDSSFGNVDINVGFAGLQQGVLDTIRDLPVDISSVNKALFDTVSAGVAAGDAIEVVGAAGRLATAGLTDISTATDGITSALNAFGISADQADSVSAKFFTAQKVGKTTIEELSSSLGLAASTAAATGVSFDELLAAVSAATTGGIQTRRAFTGIKAILSNIAKPTKDAADEAKRLGIQFDLAALRTDGLAGFLGNIEKATGGSAESLTKLFGSVEAFGVAASLTGNQSDEFAAALEKIGDSAGATETFTTAFGSQVQTAANQSLILSNQIAALQITIIQKLKPAFDAAQAALSSVLGVLQNLIQNGFGKLTPVIRVAGIALGLFVGQLVALRAVSLASAGISALTTSLSALRAGFTLTRASALALRGALLLGIPLLIEGLIQVNTRLGGFRNTLEVVSNSFKIAFAQMILTFKGFSNTITQSRVFKFLTAGKFDVKLDVDSAKANLISLQEEQDKLFDKILMTKSALSGGLEEGTSSLSSSLPGGESPLGGGGEESPGVLPGAGGVDIAKLTEQQLALRNFVIANEAYVLSNQELVTQTASNVVGSNEIIKEALSSGELAGKKTSDNLNKLVKGQKKNVLDFSKLITGTLQRAVVQSTVVMTNALLKGSNAFEAFGKLALSLIGDFLVQVGEMAISVGIASIGVKAALESLNPALAIAAGVALVALGTAFRSLGDGPKSSAGGVPTVSDTSAGGGGGGVLPPVDVSASGINPQDEDFQAQQQRRGASINVNVEGDILDSDESALRVVELIQQAGFLGSEVV